MPSLHTWSMRDYLNFALYVNPLGHSPANCLKSNGNVEKKIPDAGQILRKVYVPKAKNAVNKGTALINLEGRDAVGDAAGVVPHNASKDGIEGKGVSDTNDDSVRRAQILKGKHVLVVNSSPKQGEDARCSYVQDVLPKDIVPPALRVDLVSGPDQVIEVDSSSGYARRPVLLALETANRNDLLHQNDDDSDSVETIYAETVTYLDNDVHNS